MDTVVREIRIPGNPEPVDLAIEGERIRACRPQLSSKGSVELQGRGRLALPGFVNPHVHLDKALIGRGPKGREARTREEALEYGRTIKGTFSLLDIMRRAARVLEDAIFEGTSALRGFADVDPSVELLGIEALVTLKRLYATELTMQVTAHPQEAIYASPGTAELMEKALEAGADVVGGVPAREPTEELKKEHVDFCIDLAKRFNKDVHMMIDDTDSPESRTLEYLAVRTSEEGYQGRVVASHCGALSAYEHSNAERVIGLVRDAGICVCCNPHVSLVLGGRSDRGLIRRGTTRVREFMDAGVTVITAQDDVDDPFYPFGRMDQLEIAKYMCHVAHLTTENEQRKCVDMVTVDSARAMGLTSYGLEEGCWADFVVLDATSVRDALRYMSPRRWVFFHGRKISETIVERTRPMAANL